LGGAGGTGGAGGGAVVREPAGAFQAEYLRAWMEAGVRPGRARPQLPRRLLADEEVFELLALGQFRRQPLGRHAAAGPGLAGIVGVAVLGRNLAALLRRLARRCLFGGLLAHAAAGRGGAAEQFLDAVALGLGQGAELPAHGRHRLALGQGLLASVGLGDQGLEFLGRKAVEFDAHGFLGNADWFATNQPGNYPGNTDGNQPMAPGQTGAGRQVVLPTGIRRVFPGVCRLAQAVPGAAPSRASRAARSSCSRPAARRSRYSKLPASRPRPETTTRCGMPINSMSANICPGRRPRSSSSTSRPRSRSSAYRPSAASATAGSFFGLITHTATVQGAIGAGQQMPRSSEFCSMAAATMRETPTP